MRRLILFLAVVFFISGCHKTVYMNVQGDKHLEKMALEQQEKHPAFNRTSWQHYFINGWAPSERTIDAAKLCGGAEHIVSINTQQSIVQGLVKGFTTAYYIFSIYTPYDGNVVCDNVKMPEKSDSTKQESTPSNTTPDAAPPAP